MNLNSSQRAINFNYLQCFSIASQLLHNSFTTHNGLTSNSNIGFVTFENFEVIRKKSVFSKNNCNFRGILRIRISTLLTIIY